MKKNIKILITSCVAVVGVGASIGGAYALYKVNSATNTVFTIGTYTHSTTGNISYIVGEAQLGSSNSVINPENTEIYYNFPLGGSYSYTSQGELAAAQDVVYGNVSVTVNVDSAFIGNVEWYSYIDGYTTGSHWANWATGLRRITSYVDNQNPTISAAQTKLSKDVAVNAVSTPTIPEGVTKDDITTYSNQWLRVGFKFHNITSESEFLAVAGKSFSVTVEFGAPSSGIDVPVIATDTNGYAGDADTKLSFGMVPNIESSTWQWVYKGVTGANEMLINYEKKGDKTYYVKSTAGTNVSLDSTETYQVYYWGGVPYEGVDHNVLTVNTDTHIVYDTSAA